MQAATGPEGSPNSYMYTSVPHVLYRQLQDGRAVPIVIHVHFSATCVMQVATGREGSPDKNTWWMTDGGIFRFFVCDVDKDAPIAFSSLINNT